MSWLSAELRRSEDRLKNLVSPASMLEEPLRDVKEFLTGEKAAEEAAEAQLQAARENIDLQREMFETVRSDFAPYREQGGAAMGSLASLYGGGQTPESQYLTLEQFMASPESQIGARDAFTASPEYQFLLQEGLGAVEGSAAARGMLHSGRTLKELMRYGQGLASQEYGNWYNRRAGEWTNYANRIGSTYDDQFQRLYGLANIGQSSAAQQANAAQVATGNIMAQNQAAANAQSAAAMQGYTGTMNLLGQGMQGAALYAALSDERYKDGIKDEELGLDFVKSLRPVTYQYKESQEPRHGLIAQDMQSDFVVYDPENDAYGIKYIDILAPVIKAIQELSAKVEGR